LIGCSQDSKVRYFATIGVSCSKFYDELDRKDQFVYFLMPESGLSIQYSKSSSFGFESSIQFQGKGSKLNNGALKLNYLTVPLSAIFYIGGNKDLSLSSGIYISRIISKKLNGNINTNSAKDISDWDYGFDFRFAFPIIKIGANKISIYSRFQYGLNDVYNPLKYFNSGSSYIIWHRIKSFTFGLRCSI
jgi:hypothetical protein